MGDFAREPVCLKGLGKGDPRGATSCAMVGCNTSKTNSLTFSATASSGGFDAVSGSGGNWRTPGATS